MEESFKPSNLSVNQLFGDPQIIYKIPHYQRPYKWGSEQVEQLWADIFEAYENNIENYFLGSIITAKPMDSKSIYLDVVDGQQRMTTLMILFCVLRDNFPDINKNDETLSLVVNLDSIKSVIALNNKVQRLKLFTHAQHQSDFIETILNNGATLNIEKTFKYNLKSEQDPIYKYRNTASIFKQKLSKLDEDTRNYFINYIFFKVQIIRIDCSNRDFAIKLFQVLNDRGMDLTSADLLKSYLLENIYYKYKDDKEILKQYEKNFISDWIETENIVKDTDISLSDLLTMYIYYLLGSSPKKTLIEEAQILFKDRNPNLVISELKKFAKIYKDKIYNSDSKLIYSFRYIRWNMYWKTILMTAFVENYKYTKELLYELRRFYYLFWIAGKTGPHIKQASFNTIISIKCKKPLNYIKAIYNNRIKDDRILFMVKENLKSNIIDNEAWIKPLLILIEYGILDDSKKSYIKLDKELHLEHILPKAYKQYKEWGHITDNIKDKWLRSVANLTLLSGRKNVEASNSPFSNKMKIYESGEGKNTTSLRISQHILNDFVNKKFDCQWNEDALKDRWQWFFTQIEKLLDIDCKDIKKDGEPFRE